MSEFGAARRLFNSAEGTTKSALQITKTGKLVDLSRGYTVKGPDGVPIKFRPDTPLDKAREWTKNFYTPSDQFVTKELTMMSDEQGSLTTYVMQYKDKTGLNMLDYDQSESGQYTVRLSKLTKENKGKGLGAGMYRQLFEKAKKEGNSVRSDSTMTPDSIAIWRRFKELGYPIIEHPMEKSGTAFKRAGSDDPDAPLFEFVPESAKKKKETPKVEEAPKQEPNLSKVEPGLYYDEDSESYIRVGEDGSMSKAELE